jgi:hypothetical protein
MDKATSRRVVYSTLTGLALLSISGACFINCAPGEHVASPAANCPTPGEHHEHHRPPPHPEDTSAPYYITCTSVSDCENSSWFPVCGDYGNITCVAPASGQPKQCLIRLVNQTGCFCTERDIRNCTIGGGGTGGVGVQHCVTVGTDLTNWGGCGGS